MTTADLIRLQVFKRFFTTSRLKIPVRAKALWLNGFYNPGLKTGVNN